MSGQLGFVATDALPPSNGLVFAAEDIDELGLEMCMKVASRIRVLSAGEDFSDELALIRDADIVE